MTDLSVFVGKGFQDEAFILLSLVVLDLNFFKTFLCLHVKYTLPEEIHNLSHAQTDKHLANVMEQGTKINLKLIKAGTNPP